MATTQDDDATWMARRPWVLPVLLGLAVFSIGFDLYSGDGWNAFKHTCFYAALFASVMHRRTGRRPYRWAAIAGFVLAAVLIVIEAGPKFGWW